MSRVKKFNLRGSDRAVLIILIAMAVVIAALSIMQRAGLAPVYGSLMLYLPAAAVLLLAGWGVYMLVRRIRRDALRRALVGVLVVVVLLVVTLGFSYLGLVSNVSIPQKYSTLTSPSGAHRLVLMRGLDLDEDRIATRKAARLEAATDAGSEQEAAAPDAETSPDVAPDAAASPAAAPDAAAPNTAETAIEDYGYIYKAYPEALGGLFYRMDADVEGMAVIGYGSAGTLMMEWPDEDTAHFYVKDPGPGDGGEITVRFR